MTKPVIDFSLFLVIWNQQQNMRTPVIHLQMADWLQGALEQGERRLLLQAFRSSGKSTITGLYAAWRLLCDPSLRIIVLAADMDLARKMVRNVKKIIERHPLTKHLKPAQADQWGADRFTIMRDIEMRDPSMMAKSVQTNLTGSRADMMICDDVEVPNTCDSAGKRADLRERLGEIDYVLVPNGTQLYIGTPHHYHSIYADVARAELDEDAPFLDGFKRLSIPLLDARGRCAWPERYDEDDITRIKRMTGPNKFASQMQLVPVNITEGRLDMAALSFYDAEAIYQKELALLHIGGKKMVSASAYWDPALGRGGDASVVAVVFTDADGAYYLHHLAYIRTDDHSTEDEATQQCRAVASIMKRFQLPFITVEINGIGRFLPNILRRELANAHAPTKVRELSNSRNKELRILEAFDAVLAARLLHIHDSVKKTQLLTEMQEWRPDVKGGNDDGLDAVAGALAQEPMRVKRYYPSAGAHIWQGNHAKTHSAATEFEV